MEHLTATFAAQGTAVVMVYLSYYEQETQTLTNLLGSILAQILHKLPCILEELQDLYRDYRETGRKMSSSEHLEYIRFIIEKLSKVFIVIDALDECSENVRRPFLENILSLQPKVQLFFTSRCVTSITADLKDLEPLEISAKGDDMKQYLSKRLLEEKQLHRIVLADLCLEQSLVTTIIKRSHGM